MIIVFETVSNMMFLTACVCVLSFQLASAVPVPASGFVFPDERQQRKLEPITPPVLPVLEHLERDPSTLLPGERKQSSPNPRFGFGGGFNVAPTGTGGLTASVSSSASGAGLSHSASQSFSFGFNEGFSASHSASQASSFNGFGSFSGGQSSSQASSQAASFTGNGASISGAASAAAAQAASFGSQSASSAFGFNSVNGGFSRPDPTFGDGLLDIRHRGVPNFPFPNLLGRSKGSGAAAFRSIKGPSSRNGDDFLTLFVSN